MKFSPFRFTTTVIALSVFFLLVTATPKVEADGTYYKWPNQAVDLKWDSQNVASCEGKVNYSGAAFGGLNAYAASSKVGMVKYSVTDLTSPGVHRAQFRCPNDNTSGTLAETYYDESNLYVLPPAPTGHTASCSGDGQTITMNWTGVTGATGYTVMISKPTTQACPTGWSNDGWSIDGWTRCIKDVEGMTTFPSTSGHPHSWWVSSRAGVLYSAKAITNGTVAVGDYPYYAPAPATITCTHTAVAPSVQLDFVRDREGDQ